MAGINIPTNALLNLAGKITIFVAEGQVNPFEHLGNRTADIIMISEKDYERNKKYIQYVVDDHTKIFFY